MTFISLQSARTRAAVVGDFERWTNLMATLDGWCWEAIAAGKGVAPGCFDRRKGCAAVSRGLQSHTEPQLPDEEVNEVREYSWAHVTAQYVAHRNQSPLQT